MSWPHKIRLEIPTNAPGCFLIRGVSSNKDEAADQKLARQLTLLVQTDWDFPNLASSFGWSLVSVKSAVDLECEHRRTDGTVTCPGCRLSAAAFIAAARMWLLENEGKLADNPGYTLEPY